MLLWIGIVFWIVCGVLSVGLGMGYWKGKYPTFWSRHYRDDLIKEIMLAALMAPIGLITNYTFDRNYGKYGLRYLKHNKQDKLREVEASLDGMREHSFNHR
jgi:hypothetical protein